MFWGGLLFLGYGDAFAFTFALWYGVLQFVGGLFIVYDSCLWCSCSAVCVGGLLIKCLIARC